RAGARRGVSRGGRAPASDRQTTRTANPRETTRPPAVSFTDPVSTWFRALLGIVQLQLARTRLPARPSVPAARRSDRPAFAPQETRPPARTVAASLVDTGRVAWNRLPACGRRGTRLSRPAVRITAFTHVADGATISPRHLTES